VQPARASNRNNTQRLLVIRFIFISFLHDGVVAVIILPTQTTKGIEACIVYAGGKLLNGKKPPKSTKSDSVTLLNSQSKQSFKKRDGGL
jgi:hypothetical protein